MRISDWSSDVCSSDLPAVAAHRFHFIGKPAQRLVIGVDVERDAAIKARNRIVPCGCPCPVSDMLGRDISLRSGEEYLRTRICAQRCDMSICQREMPDERSEAALGVIVRDEGQGCRNRRVAAACGDPSRSEEHTSEIQSLMRIS